MLQQLQARWEKRAAVRSRPRIVLSDAVDADFYPVSRAPIVLHPLVVAQGDSARRFVLIQSLYKYLNDIATIETEVVNNTILMAVSNGLSVALSTEQKLALYTIMVDESYHAYVAFDCMSQIEAHTKINALPLPKKIEIQNAITATKAELDPKYHATFDLICVCLAENTLTKEIVAMSDEKGTHPFFQKMLSDHLDDESRHSAIFFNLLGYLWSNLSDVAKEDIGAVLGAFIERYLRSDVQIEFDKKILTGIGLSSDEVSTVLTEVYGAFRLTKTHPMLKNILFLLDRSGVNERAALASLAQRGWM